MPLCKANSPGSDGNAGDRLLLEAKKKKTATLHWLAVLHRLNSIRIQPHTVLTKVYIYFFSTFSEAKVNDGKLFSIQSR